MAAFRALVKAAGTDGALDHKAKELIALAISVAVRCEGCIVFHTRACLPLGVSRAELLEMLAVAVEMGGGPRRETDRINPAGGLTDVLGLGQAVARGAPLAVIHAAHEDSVRLGEAAAEDADLGTDRRPADVEGQGITVDHGEFRDVRVFLKNLGTSGGLDLVIDEEVVGPILTTGWKPIIEFVDVLAQGALGHRKDLAVDDNLRFDTPFDDHTTALVDLERDAVGLRWILGKSRRRQVLDGKVTSAEKHEGSAEQAENRPPTV